MAKPVRITRSGDSLTVYMDDGSQLRAAPTNGNNWVLGRGTGTPTPDPGTGTGTGTRVGDIPQSLAVTDTDGNHITLTNLQLTRAGGILTAALKVAGNNNASMLIALITAYTESKFHIYSNVAHYPETGGYPHDLDGSDSDSVGLFQQRPVSGWGTPKQCMDTDYSTRAFYGGSTGPNNGSPRGLFDISGWASLAPGVAAQRVQGSAYPERYAVNVPIAQAVMKALLITAPVGGGAWQWPFQYSKWVLPTPLAQFGMRLDPVVGRYQLHAGLDFGVGGINGMGIPCASDGTVDDASYSGPQGNHVHVTHAGGFATWYFHMNALPLVHTGDKVTKGQILGHVGSTGWVTGPHLHWETHVNETPVNPRQFMKDRGVPED